MFVGVEAELSTDSVIMSDEYAFRIMETKYKTSQTCYKLIT